MLANYIKMPLVFINGEMSFAIISVAVIILVAGILGWLLATRRRRGESENQFVLLNDFEAYKSLIAKEQLEQDGQLKVVTEDNSVLRTKIDSESEINNTQNESLSQVNALVAGFKTSAGSEDHSHSEFTELTGLRTRVTELKDENDKLWEAINELKKSNTSTTMDAGAALAVSAVSGSNEKEQAALDAVASKRHLINFDSIGAASESEKDDLKLIKGVGPFIEKKLNALGIWTFNQIGSFTSEDVTSVTKAIQFFPGRIERDNWVTQANELAK